MKSHVVNIEIPIDSLKQELLDALNPQFEHKRELIDAIIESLEDCNKLQYLYMGLRGQRPTVSVNIFDKLEVSTSVWKGDSFQPIGECIVTDVNPYGVYRVQVEFQNVDHMGKEITETRWISESDIVKNISSLEAILDYQ